MSLRTYPHHCRRTVHRPILALSRDWLRRGGEGPGARGRGSGGPYLRRSPSLRRAHPVRSAGRVVGGGVVEEGSVSAAVLHVPDPLAAGPMAGTQRTPALPARFRHGDGASLRPLGRQPAASTARRPHS